MYRALSVLALLGVAAARPGSFRRSTPAAPSWPIRSSSPHSKSNNGGHHGNAEQLTQEGWWHWLPQSGGIPWWNPPHKADCVNIQHHFTPSTNQPGSQSYQRAQAVKQYYVDAWNQYADHAFGNDSFNPVANTGSMGSGGWGLIIIDGVDTAVTMGLKDIADRQLAWIASQDFTKSTDPQIDGFDTTIRLIGGLLSTFDLITSGLVPYAASYDKEHVKSLLTGARDLADFLAPIFDSPTGLPYFYIDTTLRNASGTGNTATYGTIILEYHRLSDLTGDPKYRNMADKAESYLINPKPATVFPALVGSEVDIDTGLFQSKDAGWNSGIDSFYEYLIKSYVYNPDQPFAQDYKDFWVTAVDSTIKHLAVHPYGFDDVTWITQLDDSGSPLWQMDDYSCFAGGNYLLGGAYLGREDFIKLGLAFTDSCHRLFNTTVSGLNPLTIAWYGPNNTAVNPAYNGNNATAQAARSYYEAAGGYFINVESAFATLYTLYPEPIESVMYAYRITGDTKWQDYNWETFNSIKNDADRGSVVVSSLWDVTQPLGGDEYPDVPSYFFAETMKYLYLTFAEPDLVSLDDFQFNTECHPLRVQGGTCSTQSRPQLPKWFTESQS